MPAFETALETALETTLETALERAAIWLGGPTGARLVPATTLATPWLKQPLNSATKMS